MRLTPISFWQRLRILILFGILLGFLGMPAIVSAQDAPTRPWVRFVGRAGIRLEELTSGVPGEGWLLLGNPEFGSDQVGLVVRLTLDLEDAMATAEVFATPPDQETIALTETDDDVTLPDRLQPSLIIQAQGGWWVRDGRVNYNLDISTFGDVQAMWGAGLSGSWITLTGESEPAVDIIVRDHDDDGVPDWDFRQLLPDFGSRGYYRTNYVERMCPTPLRRAPTVVEAWPYLALDGAYEQEPGLLRPPIVVDWRSGRVVYFSELVTARHQNCSYTLYTINPTGLDGVNVANFEAPFAFYDLSEHGVGFPNLILRTERYPAGDPFMGEPEHTWERIRYSWRNDVGDGQWDAKIEVLGFHDYAFRTPIGGGIALMDTPPYDQFPHWVVERSWPIVTFVDVEGGSYRSSEGIYEWSPHFLGEPYFLGQSEGPDMAPLQTIAPGLRGEFRYRTALPPTLYLSPIDRRLHLLGAEGGLWPEVDGPVLRLLNLDGDAYLDGWTTAPAADAEPDGPPAEQLYHLGPYLLHAGPAGVTLRQAAPEPALFTLAPPTDRASWEAFRAALAPYQADRPHPGDLRGWLDRFPGPTQTFAGATIGAVRATADGFRFELDIPPDARIAGDALLSGERLAPGAYLAELRGAELHLAPLGPPRLSLTLGRGDRPPTTAAPLALPVRVANDGGRDEPGLTLLVQAVAPDGAIETLAEHPFAALAGAPTLAQIPWQPTRPGLWLVGAQLLDAEGDVRASAPQTFWVTPGPERDLPAATASGRSPAHVALLAALLAGLALSLVAAVALARHAVEAP